MHLASGRGPAWLGRYNGVVEVDGSNPSAPTESGTAVDFCKLKVNCRTRFLFVGNALYTGCHSD